jgi:hypothetical protein
MENQIKRLKRQVEELESNLDSVKSTVDSAIKPNLFYAIWRSICTHGYLLSFSAILVSMSTLAGCSNDEQPQQKVETVKPAHQPTFDDGAFEVDVWTINGSYYEELSSNSTHYRCKIKILNKTSHCINQIELADYGWPAQTFLSANRLFYSKANVRLDPCLQSGERREISYEIKFDDHSGGHMPSKDGPMVNSFTDTNGDIFYSKFYSND